MGHLETAQTLVAVFIADYLTVNLAADQKYLEARWSRPVNSEEFRQGWEAITHKISEHSAELLLLDFRLTSTPSITDQNWLVERVMAANKNTPLRRSARLFSKDILQNIIHEIVTDKIELFPYGYQVFWAEASAKQWLFED
ncbi:hypothetical protein CLV24_104141 [Pontibacter ummariensis]|uniref:SpoIIAA-like n=1 Tax=Pontibacter ummariensis TaxID=1610492 RepID=A0A239DAU1_9BACT|nr:hypothetical protein [Pontibacter ummariensis]PRY14331.1 hypothetical protein CLV24_104141 [Pontibacter ummariensis]SNS29387.1 hypothetical protein SAMN06296052_104140 [Pontibacter ummariensis]